MSTYNSNKARFIYFIIEKMIRRMGDHDIVTLNDIQKIITNSGELDDSTINDLAEKAVLLFLPDTPFSERVN
ncbi:hypothetical protein [Ferruginibacter sp. HRS2-29]|uniref:hypothetical protein n=1 Tax=Ferruginibacter sp. HRS2-29 TaxID=2487334 RepID=UPI0020CDF4B6|nr:hypothetical protein [Ferruginibacter sp. HRS2-29]MCP9751031.1 hypothetical protein [Ferruginibacter sp. HRS2-29]MCP9752323.1 hypothetical protein [Ferruginibacter sp. HRS2-29]